MPELPFAEQLLGGFDIGFFTADVSGGVRRLNETAAASLGYDSPAAALADARFGRMYFSLVPEWPELAALAREAGGRTVRRRIVHHRRDGRVLCLELVLALVTEAGETVLQGAFRDVTAGEERVRQTAERAAELEALQRLAVDALRLSEEKSLTQAMLEVCVRAVNAEGGAIHVYRQEADELRLVAQIGQSPAFQQRVARMRLDQGFTGRVARTREPVFLECLRESPELAFDELREMQVNNFVSYPLIDSERLLGVLNLFTVGDDAFTSRDIGLLNVLAPQASLSLAHVRRIDELRERNEDLEKFNRLAVNRELRMIELKQRIRALEKELLEEKRLPPEPS